jgi:hypothetical protein
MPNIQASGNPVTSGSVSISSKASFVTTGATVGTIETTLIVPIGAKSFRLHTKKGSSAVLTVSSSSTGTGSSLTSFDIGMGNIWNEELLSGDAAVTIYIKSSKAATDVQLLYWI